MVDVAVSKFDSALNAVRIACACLGLLVAKLDHGPVVDSTFQALKEARAAFASLGQEAAEARKKTALQAVETTTSKSKLLDAPWPRCKIATRRRSNAMRSSSWQLRSSSASHGVDMMAPQHKKRAHLTQFSGEFWADMAERAAGKLKGMCAKVTTHLASTLPAFEEFCEAEDKERLVAEVVHYNANIALPAVSVRLSAFLLAVDEKSTKSA